MRRKLRVVVLYRRDLAALLSGRTCVGARPLTLRANAERAARSGHERNFNSVQPNSEMIGSSFLITCRSLLRRAIHNAPSKRSPPRTERKLLNQPMIAMRLGKGVPRVLSIKADRIRKLRCCETT